MNYYMVVKTQFIFYGDRKGIGYFFFIRRGIFPLEIKMSIESVFCT